MYLEESSGDNGTYCNETYSLVQKNILLVVLGGVGFVSFSVCMVAVSLVFCLKLFKKFTYRLAMYQVLSGMMLGFIHVLTPSLINYSGNSLPYLIVCKARAFLVEYFMWVKLLFTVYLIFHLFCLSVFLKNLQKLELIFVLTSTLFPLLFCWVPFIHNSYGLAGAWCWIRDWKDDCATQHYIEGIIEQFTLWYGPLFVCLTISIVAAIIILIVLLWRMCIIQSSQQPLLKNDMKQKHTEILKELLPLLAYPFLFFCLYLFPLINRLYDAINKVSSFKLAFAHAVTISMTGLFSGSLLIIHVVVIKTLSSPIKKGSSTVQADSVRGPTAENYSTFFVAPAESEIDEVMECS